MTTPLDRPILQMLSIGEQEGTKYVIFPPSTDRSPVGIDGWIIDQHQIRGLVESGEKQKVIVAMPSEANWVIYSRSLMRAITQEEAIREGYARAKALRELQKELAPEEEEGGARVVSLADLLQAAGEGDEPRGPGQYL